MLGIGKGYVYWRRLCRPPFSYRQKNVSLRTTINLRLKVSRVNKSLQNLFDFFLCHFKSITFICNGCGSK